MRRNQVTIVIKRFDEKYNTSTNRQVTEIYADSNDLFEALSAAFAKAVETFSKHNNAKAYDEEDNEIIGTRR